MSKLDWYRMGGCSSDRQWNDILGVMKTQGSALDCAYLESWAMETGVMDLLRRAYKDAGLED